MKLIRFIHAPQEVGLMDVFSGPGWDQMAAIWGRKLGGDELEESMSASRGGPGWNRVGDYVVSEYKVEDVSPTLLKLVFGLDGGRSQLLLVGRATLHEGTEEWVRISSPIGLINELNLAGLITEAGDMVVGAIATAGEVVELRETLPADDLSIWQT